MPFYAVYAVAQATIQQNEGAPANREEDAKFKRWTSQSPHFDAFITEMSMPPPPVVFLPHSNELNVYTVPPRPPFLIGDARCFYPVLQIPQTPFVFQYGQPFIPYSRGDQPISHPQLQSTLAHSQPPQFGTTINNGKPLPQSAPRPFRPKPSDFANEFASRGTLPGAPPVRPKTSSGPARNDERTRRQVDRGTVRENFGRHSNTPIRPLLKADLSADSRGWQSTLGQWSASKVHPTEIWQSNYSKRQQNHPLPPGSQTKNDQTSANGCQKNAPDNLKLLYESIDKEPLHTNSQKTAKKLPYAAKIIENKDIGRALEDVLEKIDLQNKDEEKWLTARSPKKVIRNRKKHEDPEELFYKKYDRSVITLRPIVEEHDSRNILRGASKSFRVPLVSGKPSCSSKPLTDAEQLSLEKLACDLKARLTLASPKPVPSSSTPHTSNQNWSYAAIASAARLAAKPVPKPLPTPTTAEPAFVIAKRGQSLPVPPSPRTPQKGRKKVKKSPQGQSKKLRQEQLKILASRFQQALAVAVETAPRRRRKERENPKPKRLTKLKRGVLNDRLARRYAAAKITASLPFTHHNVREELPIAGDEEVGSPKPLDSQSCHIETCDRTTTQTAEASNALTAHADLDGQQLPEPPNSMIVTRNIAPPRFPELETLIEQILTLLIDFHDRAYKSNEANAAKKKKARRIVCGLREVIKHLKLNHVKFIVVAKDLEKGAYEIDDRPALEGSEADNTIKDDANAPSRTNALAKVLQQIVDLANQQQCPVILAFKRHYLRRLCRKTSAVSVVGIINVDGAEDKAKELLGQWKRCVTETAVTS